MKLSSKIARAGSSVLVATMLTACASDTVTSPVPGGIRGNVVTTPQSVFLCKIGAAGTTATFSVAATGGTIVNATPTVNASTLDAPQCVPVWNGAGLTGDQTAQLTITETAWTAGQRLNAIVTLVGSTWTNYGTEDGLPLPESKSVSVTVTQTSGGIVWFKNVTEDVPPPSGNGCTPGYWKQEQHFDSWVGFAPSQLFSSVFEDAFPGRSLVGVLGQGGGGLKALGRHTVASLLNASSGVNTQNTVAGVIARFNAVYPGTNAEYENLKNEFEAINELGCPLN